LKVYFEPSRPDREPEGSMIIEYFAAVVAKISSYFFSTAYASTISSNMP
jgi:hypothetical protein